tara:strand:- start:3015 stop:3716 length:702 start_codon:yes stop_codon:yes gene_type:complete
MATTIETSTLQVTMTESIVLNGKNKGDTTTINIPSIKEVMKRTVTATTTEVVLLLFPSALTSLGSAGSLCGAFTAANVRYLRITNKDDTNFITLVFKNEYNNEVSIKLDAGQSFIFNGDNSGGLADTINANQLAFGFTDSTCDYNDDPTVACDASKQIIPGLRVSGTGIPTDATVVSVNTAGAVTSFELSAATTGGSVTNGTLTFKSGFGDLSDITIEADTASCDVEVYAATV